MLKLKCPNCNKKISIKWLILSGNNDTYTCSNCGIKLKWNVFNRTSIILGLICGNYIIAITKDSWFHFNSLFNIVKTIFFSSFILISFIVLFYIILPNAISIKKTRYEMYRF
jgi:DNA-directed RNA polymerase subunit RPC12/RpoP